MEQAANSYLMENADEEIRLEWKTDPEDVKKQALWCGLEPGMRVLDAGCGTGKTSSILFDMVQPGGTVCGVDFSGKRVEFAREKYARSGLDFRVCDLTRPLEGLGTFDFVWVRFVLEYFRKESRDIVGHLAECLKAGGRLCLLDLDHNMLNHYELPGTMETFFQRLMKRISEEHNFDPYCGRKLYSYMYDLGFREIRMEMLPHHLIYGKIRDVDAFNWLKKVEVSAAKTSGEFENYPGGYSGFLEAFKAFFFDARRFTYTPLIICTGVKP